jgi:hypothetical protein
MAEMSGFKGGCITKADVGITENRLAERELKALNLLVSQFLDFAELQALEERSMTMAGWIDELGRQLLGNRREALTGKGSVTHKQAIEKAETELKVNREREMRQLESDFDRAVKEFSRREPAGEDE